MAPGDCFTEPADAREATMQATYHALCAHGDADERALIEHLRSDDCRASVEPRSPADDEVVE